MDRPGEPTHEWPLAVHPGCVGGHQGWAWRSGQHPGRSNCVVCQVVLVVSGVHGVLVFSIALAMVNSLRMQATSATLGALPASPFRTDAWPGLTVDKY